MGISTHILDTSEGKPAAGVHVTLEARVGDSWEPWGQYQTNDDGRVPQLVPEGRDLTAGIYRIRFAIDDYFSGKGFYPEASIQFRVQHPSEHFHVPLLLSPFGYSTYRGS